MNRSANDMQVEQYGTERASLAHLLTRSPDHLLTLLLLLAFLALYIRTAAPSVLSGDSAEFQFAAPLLGVPHPTTYPLYVLLGKLATLALPFGDLARRVTLVSAVCAALAVALFFRLAHRVTRSIGSALVASLALGFAPGLWNAATLAEVYALLMALLAGLFLLLAPATDSPDKVTRRQGDKVMGGTATGDPITVSPGHRVTVSLESWRMRAAAFVAGLGCTHHGLFVIAGLPLFAATVVWMFTRSPAHPLTRSSPISRITFHVSRFTHHVSRFTPLVLCFGAGLAPLFFPLIQFARYGPFDGVDYGLPQHYFWGAPQSWSAALDLLGGGVVRRGIFRLPSPDAALAMLHMAGARLLFEFGPLGLLLGALGCLALVRRSVVVWAGAAWVFLATLGYLLLLGPAVADAPVFTLPMLLPWALWIAAGTDLILSRLPRREQRTKNKEQRTTQRVPDQEPRIAVTRSPAHPLTRSPAHLALVALLIAATLAWGYTRLPYSSKRQLWLFRRFGEATLDLLPQGAVVLAHWEQGTTLQYLVLAERRRPDVWIDIVEPGDEAWGTRARRRYAGRPVFFVGAPGDVAGLPVELVREDTYADVFRLQE